MCTEARNVLCLRSRPRTFIAVEHEIASGILVVKGGARRTKSFDFVHLRVCALSASCGERDVCGQVSISGHNYVIRQSTAPGRRR